MKDICFFEVRAAGVGGEGIGQLGLEKLKSQVVFLLFLLLGFSFVFVLSFVTLCVFALVLVFVG